MSCTEISSIVSYKSPLPITNRCGEVYCCENLESFLIHCGTCPQQFNLLSCTLFIKHIKECKTMDFQNIEEQKLVSQDICSYAIDNLIKDSLDNNNIESGVDPEVSYIDPLMHLKLEMVKEKELELPSLDETMPNVITKQEPSECESSDSEYQQQKIEPISKKPERDNKKSLIDPSLISDLIAQYKEYPFLWDHNEPLYNCKYAKKDAYRKITAYINKKSKKYVAQKVIRQQIENILKMYKNTNDNDNKKGKDNTNHHYDKILNCIKIELLIEENKNEAKKFDHNVEEEHQNQDSITTTRELIMTAIIEEYRKLPCLWAIKYYNNDNTYRRKAFDQIAKNINDRFDTSYNHRTISSEIIKLRALYKRLKKRKEKNPKCESKVLYVEKLSFIEEKATITATQDNGQESNKISSLVNECEEESMEEIINKKNKINSKDMVFQIIDLYRAFPILWDTNHASHAIRIDRRKAIKQIIDVLAREHDCNLTIDEFRNQIRFLRSSFFKTLHQEEARQTAGADVGGSNIPIPFYFDRLSFLVPYAEKFPITAQNLNSEVPEPEEDRLYQCSVCNVRFDSRSLYACHIITHKEPHKCDQCEFQTFKRHNFNVHMQRHKGITPFKCTECEKSFVTSNEVKRHMRMHTGERPYVCDICGKSLRSNSEFSLHMKRHNNQKDHKCDLCGSAFLEPKNLRDHMLIHSNERQHACETCGAAFKRRKTLLQHKALHAEVKKHECKICGKMFAQKAGVYSHMKSHDLLAES